MGMKRTNPNANFELSDTAREKVKVELTVRIDATENENFSLQNCNRKIKNRKRNFFPFAEPDERE